MYVQAFSNLVEAAIIPASEQRLSGNIEDVNSLFSAENMRKLEEAHDGLFAFMAFLPNAKADKAVIEYIRQGSLGADAGAHILALFTLDSKAHLPKRIKEEDLQGITLSDDNSPAYEFVRGLFENSQSPQLPGILLIERFSEPTEAIFVSLDGTKTAAEVRSTSQLVFQLATSSYLKAKEASKKSSATDICIAFAANNISYHRAGKTSMRERLIKSYQWTRHHSSEIVSVLGTIGKLGKDYVG